LHSTRECCSQLFEGWTDPLETSVRARVRTFIEALIDEELDAVLARPRYGRRPSSGADGAAAGAAGHRHGSRMRTLIGTFGKAQIVVPRARLAATDGATTEWHSQALRRYQRRTMAADALIASTYLAGTNTRRVRRALTTLFGGAVSKDTVSRVWRKVKSDWDAWNARSLSDEPIVRLILDGTAVKVRLDRKATSIWQGHGTETNRHRLAHTASVPSGCCPECRGLACHRSPASRHGLQQSGHTGRGELCGPLERRFRR